MRIAYILTEDIDHHPGLKNKIHSQVSIWKTTGHDILMVSHVSGRATDLDGKVIYRDEIIQARDREGIRNKNNLYRLHQFARQYRFLKKCLKAWKPDVSYGRYGFPYFGVVAAYGAWGPYVIEINSDDLVEYGLKNKVTGIYNRIFRGGLLSKASGLVFVTHELSTSVSFASFSLNKRVIGNGIDIDKFPFVENTGNDKPNLCFIGSQNQKWHGLEKTGLIAEALPECCIHIIGPTLDQYKTLGGPIPFNMVFHGYLDDARAKKTLEGMDVGLSTLSLYEKQMSEACPLKARQYFAQGIPVIGGYRDTDIRDEAFYLELTNTSDNVKSHLPGIREFVFRVFGDQQLRRQVRSFAENNLSVGQKEMQRLSFFEEIVKDGTGA